MDLESGQDVTFNTLCVRGQGSSTMLIYGLKKNLEKSLFTGS